MRIAKKAYDIPDNHGLVNSMEIITRQEPAETADIYNIIRKHSKGIPVPINTDQPIYADISDLDKSNISSHYQNIEALRQKYIDQENKILEKQEKEKNDRIKQNEQNEPKQQNSHNQNNPV